MTDSVRYVVAILIAMSVFVLEFWGSGYSNSHALFADAWHVFGDGVSSVLGLVALLRRNYGMTSSRIERVVSLANVVFLLLIALYLVRQGFVRLDKPVVVHGWSLLAVATVGAAANFTQMRLMQGLSHSAHEHGSTKTGQVFHFFSDFLASATVVLGALLLLLGFRNADTIASFVVAFVIVYLAISLAWDMRRESHDHNHHH